MRGIGEHCPELGGGGAGCGELGRGEERVEGGWAEATRAADPAGTELALAGAQGGLEQVERPLGAGAAQVEGLGMAASLPRAARVPKPGAPGDTTAPFPHP